MTGDEWLTTVRIARDLGNVALLLPDGINDLNDAPYPVWMAISQALMVLGWEEHLTREEQPPKELWLDQDRLKVWFADVQANRKQRSSGGGGDIEDPVQNEYAADLRRKLRG